jgi:SAM-dependent methyltransferase
MRSPSTVPRAPLSEFAETVRRVLRARLPGFDPYFYVFSGDLERPAAAAQYVRHRQDQLAFAKIDPRGKIVLDAGSGFGFSLVLFGFLGAAGLFGLEIRKKMVQTCEAYAPLLPHWLRDRLDVRQGNVAMPYPDSTFDLVFQTGRFRTTETWRDSWLSRSASWSRAGCFSLPTGTME